MPRRKRLPGGNAFEQVQKQARNLLVALRGEIRSKEVELKRLKEEEAALQRLGGNTAAVARAGRVVRGSRKGGRIDWATILQQLPKQFRAADIHAINAVKNKRASEIFAAITRWIEAGTVKRKARGLYEREG